MALVLERLISDTALSLVWGGGGLALVSAGVIRMRLFQMTRVPLCAAGMMAALAALTALFIQTADIASGWDAAIDPTLLKTVAFSTNTGLALVLRALTCLLACCALLARYKKPTILLSGLALAEAALLGHAAESWDFAGIIRMSNEALHILAGSAWLGALVPFLMIVRLAGQPELRADAVVSMRQFSWIGHGAVALVFATGLANSLQILGHPPVGLQSPYQVKLALKIAAVLAMAAIAIANRYVAVPMQRRHPQRACRLLIFGSLIEIGLGLSALALVASFGLDDPA